MTERPLSRRYQDDIKSMIVPISRSWCQADIPNWHRHVMAISRVMKLQHRCDIVMSTGFSLIRASYTKFWWNQTARSTTRNFAINGVLMNISRSKKPLDIFTSNVKISIWTFLFLKKSIFSKFQKTVIFCWLVVRIPFLFCFEKLKFIFYTT